MTDTQLKLPRHSSSYGVNPRTAEALVEMGLGEMVNLHGNNGFIFLGKYQPYDEPEKAD